MKLQWYARRLGATALLTLSLTAPAAVKHKHVPKKGVVKTASKKAGSVHRRATPEEIRRAGEIAAADADRTQSERIDSSATSRASRTAEPVKTEDAVHAWVRQHQAAGTAKGTAKSRVSATSASKAVSSEAKAAPGRSEAPSKAAKDVSPRKATAADFDAAAEVQSKASEAPADPATKPRSAVTGISAPEEDSIDSDTDVSVTPAPVTRAQAAAVAKSPTPRLKLAAPASTLAVGEKSSVAAIVVRESKVHQATIDPQTSVALAKKEFGKAAVGKASLKDDDESAPEPTVADDASANYGPKSLPALLRRNGRLIIPAPMKGTHEILVHQNLMADHDGLDRIEDDDQLNSLRRQKLLAALPVNSGMQVDERLPSGRRYARPWTVHFLSDLSRAHYARFHDALQINSAVRTVDFQRKLMRTNGNAAPPTGDTASPHLTGQAIDLAKHGMSMTEIAWMRGYLLPLVQQGKIDVEEEFQQACFHISVYRRYIPAAAPRRDIPAKKSRGAGRLLAASVR